MKWNVKPTNVITLTWGTDIESGPCERRNARD